MATAEDGAERLSAKGRLEELRVSLLAKTADKARGWGIRYSVPGIYDKNDFTTVNFSFDGFYQSTVIVPGDATKNAASMAAVETAKDGFLAQFGLHNEEHIREGYRANANNTQSSQNSSAGNMQRQVERGQAPREIDRVDQGRGPFEKDHVELRDGRALNRDGTWKHGCGGPESMPSSVNEWIAVTDGAFQSDNEVFLSRLGHV